MGLGATSREEEEERAQTRLWRGDCNFFYALSCRRFTREKRASERKKREKREGLQERQPAAVSLSLSLSLAECTTKVSGWWAARKRPERHTHTERERKEKEPPLLTGKIKRFFFLLGISSTGKRGRHIPPLALQKMTCSIFLFFIITSQFHTIPRGI